MKRETKILLGILLASLVLFGYVLTRLDIGQMHAYRDLLISEDAFVQLRNERTPMKEQTPPRIWIDGQPLAFDKRTRKFLVSLPQDGPDNPSVHLESSLFREFRIAITGDLFAKEDPVIGAKILVYNENEYKEFRLESTVLPILNITVEEPVSNDLPVGPENQKAQLELYDNRKEIVAEERLLRVQTYIRLRGDSSLNFPKRQYRLNLREFSIGGAEEPLHMNLLGLRNDDDWILGSPFNDPHKIRSTFAYQLWYETVGSNNPYDIRIGTNPQFVELFIGGDYRGIYSLMHPIDRKQLNLTDDAGNKSDFHYRSVGVDPFVEQDFLHHAAVEMRGRFELRDPKPTGNPLQWEPLVRHMRALELDKEALSDYLAEYTRLPNLIDYYLFTMLLQARDNELKNHDYIAYYEMDRHRMYESPWDLDLILGLVWNINNMESINAFWGSPTYNPPARDSHIVKAIENGDKEMIRVVKDRWHELRSSHWSKNRFETKIDEFERSLFASGAVRRDRIRWPYAAYSDSLDSFRDYLYTRLAFLDAYIETLGENQP